MKLSLTVIGLKVMGLSAQMTVRLLNNMVLLLLSALGQELMRSPLVKLAVNMSVSVSIHLIVLISSPANHIQCHTWLLQTQ